MFLKKCASKVREARKKRLLGKMRLVIDLAEHMGNTARGNLSELLNTTFMIVIRRVPNGNNDHTFSNQLRASYTDVRHWDQLIDFIKQNCSPKEPDCLTAMYKCHFMQEELNE